MSNDYNNSESSFSGGSQNSNVAVANDPIAPTPETQNADAAVSTPAEADPIEELLSPVEAESEQPPVADESVSDDEELAEYEPDVPNTSVPNGGDFRWSDVGRAVEFTRLFMERPATFRSWFRWSLNMSDDLSVIQILKRLQDFDGSVWALRYTGELIDTISNGTNDFMATMRLGIQLTKLDHDLRRSLFRAIEHTVDTFPKEGVEEAPRLRYRVNMDDEQFIMTVIETIGLINEKEAVETIDATLEIVSAWNSEF